MKLSGFVHAAPEMVAVGLYHLERLTKGGQPGYQSWARAMHTDLGPKIKPVLPHLYGKLTQGPRPSTPPSARP